MRIGPFAASSISRLLLGVSLAVAGQTVAFAEGKWDFGGFIGTDLRIFAEDPIHAGQNSEHLNASLIFQPEISYEWNGGDDRITFTPFLRGDPDDGDRSHADIRELYYFHGGDGWDIRVGIDKVFWGVTESRHLVDIVNQTDAVEDVDEEDRLGQPMINLGLQRDWGDVNFFIMPYFRDRTFPGRGGRLRGPLVVDTDQAIFTHGADRKHVDLAVRYAGVFGDWDVGLAHFRGTSREPRFQLGLAGGTPVLVPVYDVINQTSADIQATLDAWLLKAEAIFRTGHGRDFFATTFGFEYSFYGIVGDAGDLGVLVEYHFDDRDGTAPPTVFDNDIFVGGRITLNDTNDTDFLAGVIVDLDTQAWSFAAQADRRLTDNLTIEAELRIGGNLSAKDPAYGTRNDSHLIFSLRYYF